MGADRRDEQFARAVVSRVLGVSVEVYDTAGRQAAVDVLLHYPDGRTAALEISSLGPKDEAAVLNILDRDGHRRTVPGLSRSWSVWVPHDFAPGRFRLLDGVLRLCEDDGLTELKQATVSSDAASALFDLGVRASAMDQPITDGAVVWVHVAPIVGFTAAGSLEIPKLLDKALLEEKMLSKVKKLAASGYEERHLFLSVRPHAFSFAVYNNLAFGGPLPSGPPRLPDGVNQVWLVSGWKEGGVVRAIADREWCRDHPFD